MRLRELITAAARTALARWVSSVLLLVLISALTLSTAAILGRALAARDTVAAQLETAGVRNIALRDTQELGFLDSTAIQLLDSLSTVELAYGTNTPRDVRNDAIGYGGATVPIWEFVGELRDVVILETGRWPREGEALVAADAQRTLQLADGFGAAGGVPIVGSFTTTAISESFGAGILQLANSNPADTVSVIASDAAYVDQTTVAILTILNQPTSRLSVQTPQSIADIQAGVLGELRESTRQQATLTMSLGILLVSAVALGDVLLNRQDIGRRRALGASRLTIIGYVVLRVAVAATAGALLSIGLLLATRITNLLVLPVTFIVAISVLNLLAMLIAAVPPAVISAYQDPVRVLRIP